MACEGIPRKGDAMGINSLVRVLSQTLGEHTKERLMKGFIVAHSGHELALSSRFLDKQLTLQHFRKWCRMSGRISKGHFAFIPLVDVIDWDRPTRTFALDEYDEVVVVHEYPARPQS